ncbi:M10 family metallopeptidase C-terminal domain-containing protein [Arsenophonus sp. aPb]|uniref:M10 family metallopeptidase C-terminal domain-containing protein n=1 Tax=Arsenophonus sp. aPb TaxID=3041619 RepID=UPI00246864DA|nr:M10 family metallopeptidase C-terminal domain-containing protein [Arsenophonus sp. aPb]WGL98251.1 M10 family metallopeptidase C-terminal domain-containing protein [Arsenophonus sp. aPb]
MIENYLTKTFSSYSKKVMEQLNSQKRGHEIKRNNKQSYDFYAASEEILNPKIADNTTSLLFEKVEITYSFGGYNGNYEISSVPTEQLRWFGEALDVWSDVANIKFTMASKDTPSDICFRISLHKPNGQISYLSKQDMHLKSIPCVFDLYKHNEILQPEKGNYGQMVLVHQIGHALGLSHPGNFTNIVSDIYSPNYLQWKERLSYWKEARYLEDTRQYTVMSNWTEKYTNADFLGAYPYTPLIDDIYAIQQLYGANMQARKGDTIYGFNANADKSYYSIKANNEVAIFSIWDTSGNDTLDFSGYFQEQCINLNSGSFSDVGGLKGNISIARGVIIENAIGGRGNDIIIGNASNNIIKGGAGSDIIYGGLGQDTLWGESNIELSALTKSIAAILSYTFFTLPYQKPQQPELIITATNLNKLLSPSSENETPTSNVFVYTTFAESLPTSPDMIMDFRTNKDKIDLSAIDARHNIARKDKNFIHFVEKFRGVPGETVISYNDKDHFHYVSINADDNLEPDFVIKVAAEAVVASDFIV